MDNTDFYVDVILPLNLPQTFTYQLKGPAVAPGQRLIVPFGKQKFYTGIVESCHQTPPQRYEAKAVVFVFDEPPLISSHQLTFWSWIAAYYCTPLGMVIKGALPSSFLLESQSVVSLKDTTELDASLSSLEQDIVAALEEGPLSMKALSKVVDRVNPMPGVQKLLQKGGVELYQQVDEKYRPKYENYVQLQAPYLNDLELLHPVFDSLQKAPKQKSVLLTYFDLYTPEKPLVSQGELLRKADAKIPALKALIEKEILESQAVQVNRALFSDQVDPVPLMPLNTAQKRALDDIQLAYEEYPTVLFEGVTASGKTEVYSHLIKEVLAAGKQVLYLVPEISLTTQLVGRLRAYFDPFLKVYHSRYSLSERTEIWEQVQRSEREAQLILGARSAVLLPFQQLGLIIVDEEHEASYKQSDPAPRYQARDAAVVFGRQLGAKVLLGSATPSLESIHNAQQGKYGWVQLVERYTGVSLPTIETIDVKQAHKDGQMKGAFSDTMIQAIQATLAAKKQVILFQNRRGYAPQMECSSCGYTPQCSQCDVSLTYHKFDHLLRCHYCGFQMQAPHQCYACGMATWDTKGLGTQQLETQIQQIFPEAVVARLDWDSTRKKGAFEDLFERFDRGEVQILVGTQMVVKGLNFKNVHLVGILNADQLMYYPDFRSHERCFQMLCQVAGRAGRAAEVGQVLLQTYQPDHPLILQIQQYDYKAFVAEELHQRRSFEYPPFVRLIQIRCLHQQLDIVQKAAEWYANVLKQYEIAIVLGPTSPGIARVRNRYIKEILVKYQGVQQRQQIKALLPKIQQSFESIAQFRNTRVQIDIDP
ncbi:MAG: replication restart helicase PriA [Flavobacteriaceae bacterium]